MLEIILFVVIGGKIGVFATILFVVISSAIGLFLIRRLGLNAMREVQHSIQDGQAPGLALIHGFLSFLGSVLLIVPGFLTSFVGLLMIFRGTQKMFLPPIFYWLRKKMKNKPVVFVQK